MKDLVENGYEWPEALEREIDKSFARMQGPVADAGFKKLLEATPEEIAEVAVRRHHQHDNRE
jgi:hypothetical protein